MSRENDLLLPIFEKSLSLDKAQGGSKALGLWQQMAKDLDEIAANTRALGKGITAVAASVHDVQASFEKSSPTAPRQAGGGNKNPTTKTPPAGGGQYPKTTQRDKTEASRQQREVQRQQRQAANRTKSQASAERIARIRESRAAGERTAEAVEKALTRGSFLSKFNPFGSKKGRGSFDRNGDIKDAAGLAAGGPFYGALKELTNATGLSDKLAERRERRAEAREAKAESREKASNRDSKGRFKRADPLVKKTEEHVELTQDSYDLAQSEAKEGKKRHKALLRAIGNAKPGMLDRFLGNRLGGRRNVVINNDRRGRRGIGVGVPDRRRRGGRDIDIDLLGGRGGRTSTARRVGGAGGRRGLLGRMFGRGAGRAAGLGAGAAVAGGGILSRSGGAAAGLGRGLLGGLGKNALKAIPIAGQLLAAGMAIYDGFQGWNNKDLHKEAFGLKDGQEATTGQKTAAAIGSVLDLGGLTSGLLGMLGIDINAADISRGLYNLGTSLSNMATSLLQGTPFEALLGIKSMDDVKNLCTSAMKGIGDGLTFAWGKAKEWGAKLGDLAGQAWTGVKDLAAEALPGITSLLSSSWTTLQGWGMTVVNFANDAWETAKTKGEEALAGIGTALNEAWTTAQGWGNKLLDLGGEAWDSAKNMAVSAMQGIGNCLSDAWESAKGVGKNLADWAGRKWEDVKQTGANIASAASATYEQGKKLLGNAWDATKGAGSWLYDHTFGLFSDDKEKKPAGAATYIGPVRNEGKPLLTAPVPAVVNVPKKEDGRVEVAAEAAQQRATGYDADNNAVLHDMYDDVHSMAQTVEETHRLLDQHFGGTGLLDLGRDDRTGGNNTPPPGAGNYPVNVGVSGGLAEGGRNINLSQVDRNVEAMTSAAISQYTSQKAGTKYKLGARSTASGQIDCSGWIIEMNRNFMDAVNRDAGKEVYSQKAKDIITRGGTSEGIINNLITATGEELRNADLSPDKIQEGTAIGIDTGYHGWEGKRQRGIDHIVQTFKDPVTGRMMISESSGGKGVHARDYAEWYKEYSQKGAKMYGARVTRLANNVPIGPSQAGNQAFTPAGPGGGVKRTADAKMGAEIKQKVINAAHARGIDPELALALIQQESGGNINDVYRNKNGTTDWGLMQVNDAVIADYNKKHGTALNPRNNVDDNITVGMDELAGHLSRYNGDVDKALLAYNRGAGGANKWLAEGRAATDWAYVRKVRSYMSATPSVAAPATTVPANASSTGERAINEVKAAAATPSPAAPNEADVAKAQAKVDQALADRDAAQAAKLDAFTPADQEAAAKRETEAQQRYMKAQANLEAVKRGEKVDFGENVAKPATQEKTAPKTIEDWKKESAEAMAARDAAQAEMAGATTDAEREKARQKIDAAQQRVMAADNYLKSRQGQGTANARNAVSPTAPRPIAPAAQNANTATPARGPRGVESAGQIAPPKDSGTNNTLTMNGVEELLSQILSAIKAGGMNKAPNGSKEPPSIGMDFDDPGANATANA